MNILLRNIEILTCDTHNKHIKSADIGIADGRIKFIGTHANDGTFIPDTVIDGKNKLVMPGLVNSHTHCSMTLLRNFADDLALEEWLFEKIFPAEAKLTSEDIYWGALLGIAEMIKSGTTSFADMYLFMDQVAQAVDETGIRANLSKSPFRFIGGESPRIIDETVGCMDYFKRYNNSSDGRIKVFVEIHSVYLFDEEKLKISAQIAKELGTGIQIHILETLRERQESIVKYGMNSVEVCAKYGVFDVPVVAAHCVHLDDNDLSIIKGKEVSVAHNPTSNLKLGSGIARVPSMLERGIHVCLGTDGTASNNNLNMVEEMHIAAILHKGEQKNPTVVNAWETVQMATAHGARAIGFGGEIGCIKEGMKADLIILDIDKPHLFPLNNPLSAVVYSAQASDVETVIIDGRIVMENRELKTIDEEKVKFKVRELSRKILS